MNDSIKREQSKTSLNSAERENQRSLTEGKSNCRTKYKSFGAKPWTLPQPVLIIGTYDKEGKPNAMNAAWGGQWDMREIVISLGSHATTDNLAVNPEFTVTFATADTLVAADYVGIVSGRKVTDKMRKTGWTIEKAPNVNAPLFKDFPMTLECRVKQKIDESETGYYLIAEIVNILCDEKYLGEDGTPDVEQMNLITYDPVHHSYIRLGETVGKAFSDGKQLK
ncbi:MAG: flavin reductase [Prevotella sp.]|nr:flavin reductase [Prevotella sp.]